jgi:ribosomal protein S21
MYIVKLPKSQQSDKMALDKVLKKLKHKIKFDGLMEELKKRRRFLTKSQKKKRKQQIKSFID